MTSNIIKKLIRHVKWNSLLWNKEQEKLYQK
jgi:hypothetical protein